MPRPTKASRKAAGEKAARTRKRNAAKTPTRRRTTALSTRPKRKTYKKRSRRRSGLSEMITNLEAKTGFEHILNGAAGGAVAYGLDEFLPAQMPPKTRMLWTAIVGFGIATVGKAPYVGAGVTAVAAYQALNEMGFLNEEPYADPLEQLPMILDAEGNTMMLNEAAETGGLYLDENNYYLDEQGNYYLDEHGDYIQNTGYQPPYATPFSGDWQDVA